MTVKLSDVLNHLQHYELDLKLRIFTKLKVDDLRVEVIETW